MDKEDYSSDDGDVIIYRLYICILFKYINLIYIVIRSVSDDFEDDDEMQLLKKQQKTSTISASCSSHKKGFR